MERSTAGLGSFKQLEESIIQHAEQLEDANRELKKEIAGHRRMEKPLQKSYKELELKVEKRSAELLRADKKLTREIKERQRTGQELKDLNELLESAFSSIYILIAYLDTNFNFIRVNRAYAEADGREPEFYIGKNHFALFPNQENEAIFRRVVSSGEPYYAFEKPFEYAKNPERGVTYWDWSLHPVKDSSGKVVRLVFSLINTTERSRALQDLRLLKEELEQRVLHRTEQLEAANRELEAFAYSVSHDLRAPLRSIEGFSQALLEDYQGRLDEVGKDYLHRIHAATQTMSALIDAILGLSSLARQPMKQEEVDLSSIAKDLASELRQMGPDRNVEFIIANGVSSIGDSHTLRVVLQNLLENAWKFSGKHSTAKIEFGMTRHEGETVYFVRDDGAGFDVAYAGNLFRAFQRLHTSAEFPGLGIGLATVQRIIHRHSGRIRAEAEVEKGATFYFTLRP